MGWPDGALPTAGPWHRACKPTPNPLWGGGAGQLLRTAWPRHLREGAKETARERGEAKPCGHGRVWPGKQNLFATAACRDADGGPFPTAGLVHGSGITLTPWGRRLLWCCLDRFPIYSHHPGSLQFFPSWYIAKCHLLRDIHIASFVSINHCQLEGKHGKRQEQSSPADGVWPWGAGASPSHCQPAPQAFSFLLIQAGRQRSLVWFFFAEVDPLPQGELQPVMRLSPTKFLSCPEQVKAGHWGGGEALWREAALHHAGQGCKPPRHTSLPAPPQ